MHLETELPNDDLQIEIGKTLIEEFAQFFGVVDDRIDESCWG